ncbi:hypothetical protein BD414DRAFT_541240 [Trametes punicea]|nr:hypothetical protein BD414DRAFT_541240 [Trametes punicea]
MLVAYVLSVFLRLKRSQRAFAIAASMFMNSNSLPIALMQSLVFTVRRMKWTEDDSNDAMFGRALTYLVVYSTLGMVLRWSYGVRLLSQADSESVQLEAAEGRGETEASPLLSAEELAFPPSAEEERILRHANMSPPPPSPTSDDGSSTAAQSPTTPRANQKWLLSGVRVNSAAAVHRSCSPLESSLFSNP